MQLNDTITIICLFLFVAASLVMFFSYGCDLHLVLFPRLNNQVSNNTTNESRLASTRHQNSKLSSKVKDSLPKFTCGPINSSKDALECSVCLTDFAEGEEGRMLPRCRHVFHVECIDMWFQSHSTCPLCRLFVDPMEGEDNLEHV